MSIKPNVSSLTAICMTRGARMANAISVATSNTKRTVQTLGLARMNDKALTKVVLIRRRKRQNR